MRPLVLLVLFMLFACAEKTWHHKEYRGQAGNTSYERCSDCHMEAICKDCHFRSTRGRL